MIAQAKKRNLIDDRRAAVGFCFGGGNVLELARDGADLAAAVSIHGDLKTALPAGKGTIKAPLLVAHGALDPVAPTADRDAFEAEMIAAGAKWQMVIFSGVLHAYTDQGADVPGVAAWDEPATRQTYALTDQFLADAFAARL
jgi:dienelactone hydrolase